MEILVNDDYKYTRPDPKNFMRLSEVKSQVYIIEEEL